MKLLTYRTSQSDPARTRLAVVDGAFAIDLNQSQPGVPSDLQEALMQSCDVTAAAKAAVASNAPRLTLAPWQWAAPIPRPGKIVCLGLNYYDHAKEGGREKPDYPWFFFRGATSLIAHGQAGIRPRVSQRLDFEAELAVVVGQYARHRTMADALDCVFGYSCFNDMSVRDYQKKTPQWTIGKNFDGTGAFGPVLVTADDLAPGATGLGIQSRLNGVVMQNANTSDMIWSVAETIVLLTECMTLEPGDLIIMGTPAGVGQARTPAVWMKDGDSIEVEIEDIGMLRNSIRDEGV